MFIERLTIRNFECHRETSLRDLSNITVLIGPNGSGKTALFEAIRTFSRLMSGPVDQAFGPPPFAFRSKLARTATEEALSFEGIIKHQDHPHESLDYQLKVGVLRSGFDAEEPVLSILQEKAVALPSGKVLVDRQSSTCLIKELPAAPMNSSMSMFAAVRARHLAGQPITGFEFIRSVARDAPLVLRYRLEPHALSHASVAPEIDDSDRQPVNLGYEGGQLASCLFWLSEVKPDVLARIVEIVKQSVPNLEGFHFNNIGADKVGFSLRFSDARRMTQAPNVSAGTLLLIGLTTLLLMPSRPRIACIEEPENGLTLDSVRVFYRTLKDHSGVQSSWARCQFLLSSHSPFVVVDAWNQDDRAFIWRLRLDQGSTVTENLKTLLDSDTTGAVLKKGGVLGLKTAEELMCGRFL